MATARHMLERMIGGGASDDQVSRSATRTSIDIESKPDVVKGASDDQASRSVTMASVDIEGKHDIPEGASDDQASRPAIKAAVDIEGPDDVRGTFDDQAPLHPPTSFMFLEMEYTVQKESDIRPSQSATTASVDVEELDMGHMAKDASDDQASRSATVASMDVERKPLSAKGALDNQVPRYPTMNSSPTIGKTSVVFVGNPGVGKSTLLSALGGDFLRGFNPVGGLTTEVSTQQVLLRQRPVQLVDIPGIYGTAQGKDDVIDQHLRMLQHTLNDGSDYVIFFVISPRNGRIDPSDLALMKLVLDNLRKGPLVGLIMTQVRRSHYGLVTSPGYLSSVYQVLAKASANTRFLEMRRVLVLQDHDKGFSDQELFEIENYVLSFKPEQVEVNNLVASLARYSFEALKRTF